MKNKEEEEYKQTNYFISKDIITIPYSSIYSNEYGLLERIDIKHLKGDDKNYNKTFIKDYFDFIQNFPNEQYLTNISLFNWWFEHKSKLKYKILNKYKLTPFYKLLNKTKGVLIPGIEPPYGWKLRLSSGFGGGHYYLDTLDIEKDFEIKSHFFLIKFTKKDKEYSMYLPFPKGLFSSGKSIYYTKDNYDYIKEMYEDDWKKIQKDIEDIEIYLNVQEKKHPLWEKHFKYALEWKRDMFIIFEKLSKRGFTTIRGFTGPKDKWDLRRHPHYDKFKTEKEKNKEKLKEEKEEEEILLLKARQKGAKVFEKELKNWLYDPERGDGRKYLREKKITTEQYLKDNLKKERKRGANYYESKEKIRLGEKKKLLTRKLDELMKDTYFENLKKQMDEGKIKNTNKEICKEKLEQLTTNWEDFIKILDMFLQGSDKWRKIKTKNYKLTSIEIKNIYFENVRDFTNETDLIKRNITLGEVKVPCVLYPRPLKPPSCWNNTWIRCPLDKSEERNIRKHYLGYKGMNVYQDTYDAWYLKDEYIENVIKFYNLKYRITNLEEFEECLKKKITVDKDIDEMYPEFDEDKSEKIVVKEKKHKIIIKQEKFVKKLEDESEIIASLLIKYNNIKDIFKEVPILKNGEEMSITQYEEALKKRKRGKLLDYKTIQTKATMDLLILFLLWGNQEFNEPKYFRRKREDGKSNTYWYKEIYDYDKRTWITLSKNEIKKLSKKEIGKIWYNLYRKIEEFDLTKRKDTKNNNVLEGVIKKFKKKDFNQDIDKSLFKVIKDEAHIYLSVGDKNYIIDYFKYLRIHYEYLKQNLQEEEKYLMKLNKMKPEQLDKEASGVAQGSNKKINKKPKPKITAEQEIKLDIICNNYKKEYKYLTNKWKDFIEDATSTLVQRKIVKDNINEDIKLITEDIKKNEENFNTNRENYMPTKEFMDLKKQIASKKEQCEQIKERMEKLVSKNPKLRELLKEIELLDKNLGIAINEHSKHRTDMKRKVTYPTMVDAYDKIKDAKKKYIDAIENIPSYQLHLICEARVEEIENKIKTSFSEYIEENIMRPTRLLKEKIERRDWLLLLLAPNLKNKLRFSILYKKQYEKLRNVYLKIQQIQDRLIILRREEQEIDKFNLEIEEFQKKYKRFKADEHYFT